MNINQELKDYVETQIIPLYDTFDKAHRRDHVNYVIDESLRLSSFYPETDRNMVYAIAAFHDTGLSVGRDVHHIVSHDIILADKMLLKCFSQSQLITMAEAAEDHRASSDHEPRTIYGRIVAEADRQIDPETVMRRTVQFGLSHYPELDREAQWKRFSDHMDEKYSSRGYLKLWIPYSQNASKLEELRAIIADPAKLQESFNRIYSEQTK